MSSDRTWETAPINHSHYACLGSLAVDGLFWSDRRQNAACSHQLSFSGFLRCGEFTVQGSDQFDPARHLTVKVITFYPHHIRPDYMTLRLKYSKTNPFGKGHIVTLYRTNRSTCPVTSMQVYLNSRGWSLQEP